jgi:predicted adenylyl cyclase CyaB
VPRNIEVKVRLADSVRARDAALAAGARSASVEIQTDRYYELAGGRRVKLRTRGGGGAELIHYDRPETDAVRASDYEVTPVRDAAARACLVPKGAPVAVVRKRREVLLLDNVRIHLDEVDGLGAFLELEAVVDQQHDDAACRRQVAALLDALGLASSHAVLASYGELIREKGPRGLQPLGKRLPQMRVERHDVALAATLHDTTGALARDVRRWLCWLQARYAVVAVATSPPTSPRIVALLREAGAYAGTPAADRRGPLYRLSIRRALASGAGRVHYVDFDRALHWAATLPRELPRVLRVARRVPTLLIGRTRRAHLSHHRPLHATEGVVNRLFAERLGIAGRVDFLVPSFVVDRDGARRLLSRSRARDASIYGEWAALLAGLPGPMAYVECRGLDWETPDRHRRAVRRTGLATWRRRQETPAEWALRIDIAAAIVRGFTRTLARVPVPRSRRSATRTPMGPAGPVPPRRTVPLRL